MCGAVQHATRCKQPSQAGPVAFSAVAIYSRPQEDSIQWALGVGCVGLEYVGPEDAGLEPCVGLRLCRPGEQGVSALGVGFVGLGSRVCRPGEQGVSALGVGLGSRVCRH